MALSYAAGPFWGGVSFENPSGNEDQLINAGAKFTFGVVTLSGGVGTGKVEAATNNKLRTYLVGANIAVGSGDIKVGYAAAKVRDVSVNSRIGVGYHHNLSKRTKLFVDFAREAKILTENKTGYDVGIQHNF